MAGQVAAGLDALAGRPLSTRVVADEAAARREIHDRRVYGAYVMGAYGAERPD